MKKSTLFLTTFLLIITISGAGSATTILESDNGEENLFEIWNEIFSDVQTSSQDLFNTYGVPDGMDYYWQVVNDAHIYASWRYAGYEQAIGIDDSTGESILINDIIPEDDYFYLGFSATGSFSWLDQYTTYSGSSRKWYSTNAPGGNDHFVALTVPDELVCYYNGTHEIDLMMSNVYLLAFEDADLGDQDYNDLVFLVDNVTPAPVPEPTTMLLFGSGLIGLAGFSRKRAIHSHST